MGKSQQIFSSEYIQNIINTKSGDEHLDEIGRSEAQRPIMAIKTGKGPLNISLIGGAHADEPVGPDMLRKLSYFLVNLPKDHQLIQNFTWHIIPHINPDGEAKNQIWYNDEISYDLSDYLKHVVREKPGRDLEFGFPSVNGIKSLRVENEVVYQFWKDAKAPFHLHASFHGMMHGFGPWFLAEKSWGNKIATLMKNMKNGVIERGYQLFDIDRGGEKGFKRLGEGFCSRPDSESMKRFFLEDNQPAEAAKFHLSSMESTRLLSGDIFTMVTEMPLFLYPGDPSDKVLYQFFKNTFKDWQGKLAANEITPNEVKFQANQLGIKPMPVKDQQYFQLLYLSEALKAI